MNLSRKPVSAQPRGYDDTASRINEFPDTAEHYQDSECARLETEREGANVRTEIEVLSWNRPFLRAVVAEYMHHHFASDSSQGISKLSKSDPAYAVTVTNIGIPVSQGARLPGCCDSNFDSRAAVTSRRIDRLKSFTGIRLRIQSNDNQEI